MSGDSPNAFTNEHAFDFKEGRHSPGPTTSKVDAVTTASIQVEPQKEPKDKDDRKEDAGPEFNTPILNPGDEGTSDDRKSPDEHDSNWNSGGGGKGGGGDGSIIDDDDREKKNLLNGGLEKSSDHNTPKAYQEEEDDTCLVNCIYYTMECCKCSIM